LHIFNPDIEDEAIEENILSGAYSLYSYAGTQWLDIVSKVVSILQEDERMTQLVDCIDHFIDQRYNPAYKLPEEQLQRIIDFNIFKTQRPSLHDTLVHALHFRRLNIGEWRLDEGKPKIFQLAWFLS
jgi:hypothetical protein